MTSDIGTTAMRGLLWSAAQNWGGRLITFAMFAILARLLTPADYGVASAALVVVAFVTMVSEFGFGDAIIQRRDLKPEDVDLPFVVSVATSFLLSGVIVAFAGAFEVWLKAPGLTPILIGLGALAPIMTLSVFQEINYKRVFAFRTLAFRVLIANVVGGVAAVAAAGLGAGVWSLVLQSYVTALVGLIWLWWSPMWRPQWRFTVESLRPLGRFALPVITMRIVDFVSSRVVELIIIRQFGIAAFGVYSVGARLYQILLILLQSVLNDVSLPVLSTVADDRERLGRIYLQSVNFSTFLATPIFVLFAALSPEICDVLFGAKWAGVDAISLPLLLVGAVQCVQHLNGPYMTARGRPGKTLVLGLIKYMIIIVGLLAVSFDRIDHLVAYYAVLQLAVTPLSFAVAAHELGLSYLKVARILFVGGIGCAIAFFGVVVARPFVSPILPHGILSGIALGLVYSACLLAFYVMFARRQLGEIIRFVTTRIGKGKPNAA
ncbi:lipopolysaccharide biosynthesis protein [Siculibacillus lacustris]|uniref:Lipopolysaccharide biosynthesis protein n=1 Tax=Siculibacillus lacustris TaxID=1549641 RepID=A0A4Q9VE87_9HYPH|nr:oligosaccharide flippase family protein [Siculibacillus lacustris]TBW32962.1 lipopolysaccharide biosynthesis protein [Siculibacillus lacustris]